MALEVGLLALQLAKSNKYTPDAPLQLRAPAAQIKQKAEGTNTSERL